MSQRVLRSQSGAIDDMDAPTGDTPHEENGQSTGTVQGTVPDQGLVANENQTPNSPSEDSEAGLQAEYEQLTAAKTRALLRQDVATLRAEASTGFQQTVTLTHRPKGTDSALVLSESAQKRKEAMQLERNYTITDPPLYMGKSLKELETFELLCMDAFEVKPVTYSESIVRIQYARGRLGPDPKASWSREAKRLNREGLA